MLAGTKVAIHAGPRQKIWLEAIQKRVGVTASMLGAMKSVKMLGLARNLSVIIQELRTEEIKSSRKFRELLILVVSLCEIKVHVHLVTLDLLTDRV